MHCEQEVVHPSPMVPIILIAYIFYHNVPTPKISKKQCHYLILHNDRRATSCPILDGSLLGNSEALDMSGVCCKY